MLGFPSPPTLPSLYARGIANRIIAKAFDGVGTIKLNAMRRHLAGIIRTVRIDDAFASESTSRGVDRKNTTHDTPPRYTESGIQRTRAEERTCKSNNNLIVNVAQSKLTKTLKTVLQSVFNNFSSFFLAVSYFPGY